MKQQRARKLAKATRAVAVAAATEVHANEANTSLVIQATQATTQVASATTSNDAIASAPPSAPHQPRRKAPPHWSRLQQIPSWVVDKKLRRKQDRFAAALLTEQQHSATSNASYGDSVVELECRLGVSTLRPPQPPPLPPSPHHRAETLDSTTATLLSPQPIIGSYRKDQLPSNTTHLHDALHDGFTFDSFHTHVSKEQFTRFAVNAVKHGCVALSESAFLVLDTFYEHESPTGSNTASLLLRSSFEEPHQVLLLSHLVHDLNLRSIMGMASHEPSVERPLPPHNSATPMMESDSPWQNRPSNEPVATTVYTRMLPPARNDGIATGRVLLKKHPIFSLTMCNVMTTDVDFKLSFAVEQRLDSIPFASLQPWKTQSASSTSTTSTGRNAKPVAEQQRGEINTHVSSALPSSLVQYKTRMARCKSRKSFWLSKHQAMQMLRGGGLGRRNNGHHNEVVNAMPYYRIDCSMVWTSHARFNAGDVARHQHDAYFNGTHTIATQPRYEIEVECLQPETHSPGEAQLPEAEQQAYVLQEMQDLTKALLREWMEAECGEYMCSSMY